MREREVKARVKLLMISMGLRPDRRGFVLIAEAITEQAVKGLTMKSVYERLGRKLNQTRGCMERSMRLCINDLNVGAFAHQMNELTGFRVVTENMKLSCNAFVGMMAEVISIVYGIENDEMCIECDIPPEEE